MLSLNSKVYEVSTSLSTQLEQIIAEAMPTMANGEKMPLIPEPEVSESYKSAFDKYYEISHTDQMLTTVINSIKSLTAALPKDNSNNKEIDSFIDYLSKTTKSLSLRLLVDAASEDDLNYLTEKTSMPEMQKYITCTMGITQDAMGLAQKIMSNLQASLKIQ